MTDAPVPLHQQPPALRPLASYAEQLQKFDTNAARFAERTDAAPWRGSADITCSGVGDEELHSLFADMTQAVPHFPKWGRTVHVSTYYATDQDRLGETEPNLASLKRPGDPDIWIRIKINPNIPMTPAYRARLAYLFLHELGEHGVGMSNSLSEGNRPVPGSVGHFKSLAPPDESNAWFKVVKSGLRFIPDDPKDEQKSNFALAYVLDLRMTSRVDAFGGGTAHDGFRFARRDPKVFNEAQVWAGTVDGNRSNMRSDFWRHEEPDTLPGDIGVDEDPRLGRDTNWMRYDKSDLYRAIEHMDQAQAFRDGQAGSSASVPASAG